VDLGVVSRELPGFEPTHVLDTLKLARRLLPGRESYKLGALAHALGLVDGLPPDSAPHRATYDATVCARLLVQLVTLAPSRPPSLTDLLNPAPGKPEAPATLF
jgi:DNA polymerase III epsilon subunit-like protein